jgi:hypothetical protein
VIIQHLGEGPLPMSAATATPGPNSPSLHSRALRRSREAPPSPAAAVAIDRRNSFGLPFSALAGPQRCTKIHINYIK